MRTLVLLACWLLAQGAVRAEVWTLDQWLTHGDSLRAMGQDAAALEAYASAEQTFLDLGDDCAVARCAERISRIHIEWENPNHADAALTRAMEAGISCPSLLAARTLWSLALGELKLNLGQRAPARTWLVQVPMGVTDSASLGRRLAAVEALGLLARMSLEEGDYERAESEHLQWAAGWLSAGRRDEAAVAMGWSGVCGALSRPDSIPVVWASLPGDAAWTAMSKEARMQHALAWGKTLTAGGAFPAFDDLVNWNGAGPADSVDPIWEAEWALLQAQRWRSRPSQALAASLRAELAARRIDDKATREPVLQDALRLRADLLAKTGAHRPAYRALLEADSLLLSAQRAARARTGLFESEPWLAAIGDARTAMETQRADWWQQAAVAAGALALLMMAMFWRGHRLSRRAHRRLRRLQQQWLPGKQQQMEALARSGTRMVELAGGHALPHELQREMSAFGRLAALCSAETRHTDVDLEAICSELAGHDAAAGRLDWTLREDVPFRGDADQVRDFLKVLLDGVGRGGCRLDLNSRPEGLQVELDSFEERGWWREAMHLFAGDGQDEHWALVRLRCDRLGGTLHLDCSAVGAERLQVSLPVYSA